MAGDTGDANSSGRESLEGSPAGFPREAEVAFSYLEDVEKQIRRDVKSETHNVLIRAQAAKEIQRGDLARAHRELDRLQAAGFDPDALAAARATAHFKEGNLAWAVATSGGPETGDQAKWLKAAAQAFEKSVQVSPTASAYFNLGLCYKLLDRKSSAVEAFGKAKACAEQLGDARLSLEAHKEIDRLGPQGRNSLGASGGGHALVPARKKKPHWGFIGWGIVCVLFTGSFPFFFLIGAALIAWGVLKGKPD